MNMCSCGEQVGTLGGVRLNAGKQQYSREGNQTLSKVHQQGEQTRVGWNAGNAKVVVRFLKEKIVSLSGHCDTQRLECIAVDGFLDF